jgi:hypothetical protein
MSVVDERNEYRVLAECDKKKTGVCGEKPVLVQETSHGLSHKKYIVFGTQEITET